MPPPQVIVVVASESSVKTPPKVSGSGFSLKEDPLQFLKDFLETATGNNWSQNARLKKLFYRCLQGMVKEWFFTCVRKTPEYIAGQISFEASDKDQKSVIWLFKDKFVTPIWLLAMKFCMTTNNAKAHLRYHNKANAKGAYNKTEKERTRDLCKSLLPDLLQRSSEDITPLANKTSSSAVAVGNTTVQEEPHSKYDKTILNKLERIENNLAITKDKMQRYDRSLELLANKTGSVKCYNFHRSEFSPRLFSLGEEGPNLQENPKPGPVNTVIVEVNAVKEKKSDDEFLAARIRNLEKAGAMKALYKSKWNPDNVDLDQVNLLKLDTSKSEAVTVALQAVYAFVDDEILEFLIDGGAMTSLIPYYVVRKLKLTSNIMSSQPDAAQGYFEFTGKDGSKFVVVNTVDGDGMLKEHGMLPEGAVPEDPEALIIPVLLKQNTWNPKIQDVNKLNEAMGFSLGETTMLPLKIAKDAASWAYNRALQPDAAALWGRGLYVMMPMVLHSGKIFDNAPHSIAILNTAKEVIAKERSTRLGKLYNASSIIPDVVELLDSFDDYHSDQVQEDPSLFTVPVYTPERFVANTLTVNTMSCTPPLQFDINEELTADQQSELYNIFLAIHLSSLRL
ncbi:unnamed protein product [Mucor circinelloides]